MFSHLPQALEWIETTANLHYVHAKTSEKFQRIEFLLESLDRPQDEMKIIHIAGSKGKSSTAQALSFLLEQQGYRTGLFSSPHVHRYNERIRLHDTIVQDHLLLFALNTLHEIIVQKQKKEPHFLPSTFEILLASAMFLFRKQKIDFAIVEAGIGGLLDTSNILNPILCIICNIEFEHQKILGDSIEEIAWQKAGIIKSEVPVVLGQQQYEKATQIVQEQAQHMHAPCYLYSDYVKEHVLSRTVQGMHIEVEIEGPQMEKSKTQVQTACVLPAIAKNQILAYLSCRVLALHKEIEADTFHAQLQLPSSALAACRAEIFFGNPQLYLDLAHTPLSIFSTLETAFTLFEKVVLLMGLSEDKDHNAIGQILESLFCKSKNAQKIQKIYCTGTDSDRSKDPTLLLDAFSKIQAVSDKLDLIAESNIAFSNAITLAQETESCVVICGSVFLCAHCRSLYQSGEFHKDVS